MDRYRPYDKAKLTKKEEKMKEQEITMSSDRIEQSSPAEQTCTESQNEPVDAAESLTAEVPVEQTDSSPEVKGADSEESDIKKPKKKSRAKRITVAVILVLLSFLIIVFGVVYGLFRHYYGMLDYEELFSGEDSWTGEYVEEEEAPDETIDTSKLASDEEKDQYLEQIENVGSGNFEIDITEIGGSLGKVERSYTCDYISQRDDVINILLIGLDSRYNINVGRSDVMMVVSICPSEKKIMLTSFLRDVYVMIPGYGANKLNAAYAFGGPSLLVETIEKNFGLRIDRYATSNFFAFVDVVNYLGKLNIYINETELSVLNQHIYWTNLVVSKVNDRKKDAIENKGAGYYELNGIQALAYARIRNVDSDFGRTSRQRTVMSAIFERVRKMTPAEWNDLLTHVLPMVTTNLTESDILKLMLNVGAYSKYEMKTISMPPEDNFRYMQINGSSVIGVDLDYIRKYLALQIYSLSEEQN